MNQTLFLIKVKSATVFFGITNGKTHFEATVRASLIDIQKTVLISIIPRNTEIVYLISKDFEFFILLNSKLSFMKQQSAHYDGHSIFLFTMYL